MPEIIWVSDNTDIPRETNEQAIDEQDQPKTDQLKKPIGPSPTRGIEKAAQEEADREEAEAILDIMQPWDWK